MKRRHLFPTLCSLVAPPLFMGCAGEQFGGSLDGDPIQCVSVRVQELDVDEQSALGFSPAEVMSFLGGSHEADFVWGPSTERQDEIVVRPAPGPTSLTVRVREEGATYSLVDLELEEGSSWAGEENVACPDELRIRAQVSITSDNGAFDDDIEMELVAQQPLLVSGTLDMAANDTDTRELELTKDNSQLVAQELSLYWTPGGGLSGRAVVDYETRTHSSANMPPSIILADFPEDSLCEGAGVDLPEDSAPAEAVHAALEAIERMKVHWSDEEEDTFELELLGSQFCVRPPSPYHGHAGGLTFEVSATRHASDGTLLDPWLLQGSGDSSVGGQISALLLSLDEEGAPIVAASTFQSQYGFDLDGLDEHDEAQLLLNLQWEKDRGWHGNLTVQARSHDDPCFPENLTHPIPSACITDGVYLGGWATLATGAVMLE